MGFEDKVYMIKRQAPHPFKSFKKGENEKDMPF
jgi:hypothetical protein